MTDQCAMPAYPEWRPISTAPNDGAQCRLRYRDPLGYYELPFNCFLHDDGFWYRIDPPRQLTGKPTHWKPALSDQPTRQEDAA